MPPAWRGVVRLILTAETNRYNPDKVALVSGDPSLLIHFKLIHFPYSIPCVVRIPSSRGGALAPGLLVFHFSVFPFEDPQGASTYATHSSSIWGQLVDRENHPAKSTVFELMMVHVQSLFAILSA